MPRQKRALQGDELDTSEDERVAGKPLSDFPEWKWSFTRRGKYFAHMYTDEIDKSDPDCFGMYAYNDYAGYGAQEVIENQLNAFDPLDVADPDGLFHDFE